jgi:signal peptidase II
MINKFKTSAIVKTLIIIVVIMLNIGCDQVSKHIVRQSIGTYQNIDLISNHFTLTKVENTGAFLSLGDNIPAPIKFVLLSLLPLLVMAGGIIYLFTRKHLPRIPLIAACFIIGGGIGNIYDRLLYGSVTDFMHIGFGIFQTGIFNMADVSVMVGMFMLLGWYYLQGKRAVQEV